MKDLFDTLNNAYTYFDLILIIGFAVLAYVYYRRNRKLQNKLDMYYNTTGQEKQMLIDFESKAQKQDEKVMEIFNECIELSASMAYRKFNDAKVPLTSIRRAITDLYKQGKLIRLDKMANGSFGRPEHIYRLKTA